MNRIKYASLFLAVLSVTFSGFSQEEKVEEKQEGHTNQNKFRQLYDEFATPNVYRTASGAPGHQYYQNTADYEMDITLDDENTMLYGKETITYTNNSPDALEYLWVMLDQNIRAKDSPAKERNSGEFAPVTPAPSFVNSHMKADFDGGFNIKKSS